MSWLEKHLDEFVRPVVGDFDKTPLGFFKPEEITIMKNAWRATKKNAQGRQIFLPGRDVWLFEVLARREGYPTLFMPECSRMTVDKIRIDHGAFKNVYIFDTGFLGSIPKGLRVKKFNLLSYSNKHQNVGVQTFPRLTMSRGFALRIESTPKYWSSGRLNGESQVIQDLSDEHEFKRAARLTIEVYKSSSPKFIKKHKPLPRRIGGILVN